MPDNHQEIAQIRLLHYLEEGVLAGVGVLLLFLGYESSGPITAIFSIGIGVFLLYISFEIYKFKWHDGQGKGKEIHSVDVDDEAEEEIERELYSENVDVEQHHEVVVQKRVEKKRPVISPQNFVERTPSLPMTTVEPKSEFHNLLGKVLAAAKDVCFAHSAVFFWVNADSHHLIVEAKVTDSDNFVAERKLPIGNDVVSQIGLYGKPQVINDISSDTERDVLCYYKSLQEVRSFIGVPVFYVNDMAAEIPIGVLAVDSKAQDEFGEETFSILGHFAKLISAMLASSTEKYDLLIDTKLVKAAKRLKTALGLKPTLPVIVNSLMEEVEKLIEWDALALVLFEESQQQWTIASARTKGAESFVAPKQVVDFNNSIVGTSLRTNVVQSIDLGKNSGIVFHEGDSSLPLLRKGWLTTVPITSNGKCFGTITVVNASGPAIDPKDVDAIQLLLAPSASALEVIELNAIITDHVVIDELTGTLTKKNFLLRLSDELSRATDRGEDLSLVLVSLSNIAELEKHYGESGRDAALKNVGTQLRASVRQYDIVARFNEATFALILTDTIASDAYLWAEKVRGAIAATIIAADKKSFSVSVTIGISGAASRMQSEELIKNATYVLDQAMRAGGNIVRVF